MSDTEWAFVVEALRDHKNVERALAAAQELQRTATTADIPRLLELLKDKSFFVREAAAWPLSDLGVTGALPDMLQALHMGWQEGHDNDGLSAALSDLAEASPAESALVLRRIVASGQPHLREHAKWLLEFCHGELDA